MTEPKDDKVTSETVATGPAVAVAQVQNNITIVNAPPPRRVRQHTPHGGQHARTERAGTSNANPVTGNTVGQTVVSGATAGANLGAAAATTAPTTEEWIDNEGRRTQQIRDSQGGRIVLRHDADGRVNVWYTDNDEWLYTNSRESGFTRVRQEPYTESGEPRTRFVVDGAVEYYDGWLNNNGPYIDCRTNQPNRNWNWVRDDQIDAVTRGEVQNFLNQHQQLRDSLRTLGAPITELGDQPVTVDQVMSPAATHRACPANHPDRLIDIVR